jgi:hypothetical protein
MENNMKIVAWVSIIGAGIGAGLITAIKFFPDFTAILTAAGALIGAAVAYLVNKYRRE